MTITEEVRALRAALGENTATFGARWHRSGRTVETWEQGLRQPDPLVLEGLQQMRAYLEKTGALGGNARTKKAKAAKKATTRAR